MQDLFPATSVKAQLSRCKLFLSHPSDLFQIQASNFYNSHNISLMLYIPMAPSDLILRLIQL